MGVFEGRGQLSKSLKELINAWLDCKASWKDANADRFEKKHIIPLEQDLRSAVGAMDVMAQLLGHIRRDCE